MYMRLFLLTILLLLSGCDNSGRVRVFFLTQESSGPSTELPDWLHDACDLLQITCEATDEMKGALVVEHIETESKYKGRAFQVHRCMGIARTTSDVYTAAHEMGHLLGLVHVSDRRNFMYEHVNNWASPTITDGQLDRVRDRADELDHCR